MSEFELGGAAGGQYVDVSGDGVFDTVVVPTSDGNTSVFVDQDQNGVYEGATVFRADNSVAVTFQDGDQNGQYDGASVDQNGNGKPDTWLADTTGDGQFDTQLVDLNENGVDDSREAGSAATGTPLVGGSGWSFTSGTGEGVVGTGFGMVGPVTNPDPLYELIVGIAGETGVVAYGPPDSDHDGVYDNYDAHPHDPFKR